MVIGSHVSAEDVIAPDINTPEDVNTVSDTSPEVVTDESEEDIEEEANTLAEEQDAVIVPEEDSPTGEDTGT